MPSKSSKWLRSVFGPRDPRSEHTPPTGPREYSQDSWCRPAGRMSDHAHRILLRWESESTTFAPKPHRQEGEMDGPVGSWVELLLHNRGIMHRDLKPENVLLTNRKYEDIKIGDFGLARKYLALKKVEVRKFSSLLENYYMGTGAGTLPYIAPEVFEGHYTERADVFSLGCIFYAILERKCIQCDNGEACYAAFVTVSGSQLGLVEAMFHDPVFSDVGRQLSFRNTKDRLLKKMTCDALERDPDDRPSAEAISCGIELICSDESLI